MIYLILNSIPDIAKTPITVDTFIDQLISFCSSTKLIIVLPYQSRWTIRELLLLLDIFVLYSVNYVLCCKSAVTLDKSDQVH